MLRRGTAVAGMLAAVLGLGMVLWPDLARTIGLQRWWLLPVAVVLLFQGYRVVQDRRHTPVETADTPDPETEQDLPVPGDEFDRDVDDAERGPGPVNRQRISPGVRASRRVENRLEDAAVDAISRKWGCSREQAREALWDGSWTDDPYAAAFFTDRLEGVQLRRRIRLALGPEPQFERRAARAAAAIHDLSTGHAGDSVDDGGVDE
jgi:hypothetical protein